MKVKALKTIIEFDGGQMVVINTDEVGELSQEKAAAHIAAGSAVEAKGGKGKAAAPEPDAAAADAAGGADEQAPV
jgi:hypothetical protein